MEQKNLRFAPLKAEEVDCRVNVVKDTGLSLVLHLDARTVMNKFDEAVGPLNWKREHRLVGDSLYCTISVYDADKQEWIVKEDVGSASNSAAEKGAASDSFKRAAVSFGIGRELYFTPFIFIRKGDYETKYDKFVVTEFETENGRITSLKIKNTKTNKEVYKYSAGSSKSQGRMAESESQEDVPTVFDIVKGASVLTELKELMKSDGISPYQVKDFCMEKGREKYGITPAMKLQDYPDQLLRNLVKRWDKIKEYICSQNLDEGIA